MSTDQQKEKLSQPESQTPSEIPSASYYERALHLIKTSGKRPINPLSAFCSYYQERRGEMKAKDPSLTQKVMHPFIMKDWKALEDKEFYYRQAREHFQEYKKLLTIWSQSSEKSDTLEIEPPVLRKRKVTETKSLALETTHDAVSDREQSSELKKRRNKKDTAKIEPVFEDNKIEE